MNLLDTDLVTNLLKDKKWKEVIFYLNNLSNNQEDTTFCISSYYKSFIGLKNYKFAELYIDKLLSHLDDNPTLYRDKGICCQDRGDLDSALNYFSKAIKIRPDIASYYASRGNAWIKINNLENAIIDYRKAVEIDPEKVVWIKKLGNLLLKNNDTLDAIEEYERYLKLTEDPDISTILHELKHQIQNKTKEASANYYDYVFENSKKYLDSAESGIYIQIWQYIADLLKENHYTDIVDLGCGPGQFAEFIKDKVTNLNYTGIDFSKQAIKVAQQRCPEFTFINKKLPIVNLDSIVSFDAIICTEVLEHIEEDINILKSVSEGTPIIASVPNFYSFGHVRYFYNIEEVENRYTGLFKNLTITPFNIGNGNIIWVIFGIKS